ncbi:DUF2188 domain-containing protein [Saccharomonospora saliphila]|uniref:DUF2188 domain-containing protein n=1 Tax=Saccharomonospora saliphila TaxID=369829 RepID=UPI0003702F96|nr:DUF2188 domain-containing protein [Saccharomonospora saliphila]
MAVRYRVVFRFSPDSLTWLVERGDEVLSRWCRRHDAVREAARCAREGAPSTLTVERVDGTVQQRRRYPRPRSADDG